MKVKGVEEYKLKEIAAQLGFKLQDINKIGRFIKFVIRMENTSKKSPNARYRKLGFSGRRTSAICFHGHWKFFEQIFRHNPRALIVTSKHRWTSLDQLNNEAWEVGEQQVGSVFNPQTYDSQCNC